MDKKELLSYTGSIEQLMSVRPVDYKEGRARGLSAYEVKNHRLSFLVMADKCLDIAEVNWMGYNMSFLSKPGLSGRQHYDTHGQEAQRSIMGGMLFTCGLENICAPCTVDGRDYPMHGRIRTTGAQHVGAGLYWNEDGVPPAAGEYSGAPDGAVVSGGACSGASVPGGCEKSGGADVSSAGAPCAVRICGEMREAELFGENMVLRRTIETAFGVPEIVIKDTITNEGFREEPMMLLYHFNVGYPFLDENCEILLPTEAVVPRDEAAKTNIGQYNRMEKPEDNAPERVYLHQLRADSEGNTFAAVINEPLGIGVKLEFNKKYLPYFMQWKSIASGDYVVGLEPANSSVYGKPYHIEKGDLHTLAPFASEEITLRLRFLSGEELLQVKAQTAKFKDND